LDQQDRAMSSLPVPAHDEILGRRDCNAPSPPASAPEDLDQQDRANVVTACPRA
jgi:hypothetical protein